MRPPRTPQRVLAPGPHTFTRKPQRTLRPSRLGLDDADQGPADTLAQARDNPTMRYLGPVLLGVVLVATGCGGVTAHGSGNCSPKHVSVATARSEQPKQLVRVEGHYLRKNGITRLCDAVIASGSPRCAGSSLVVRRYEPRPQTMNHHANGVAWSDTVHIFGLVSGTTLRVAGCA
jgi:hypothetical protein